MRYIKLSGRELEILKEIGLNKPISAYKYAKKCNVAYGGIHRLIKNLEEKGMISKDINEHLNDNNRPVIYYWLTFRGAAELIKHLSLYDYNSISDIERIFKNIQKSILTKFWPKLINLIKKTNEFRDLALRMFIMNFIDFCNDNYYPRFCFAFIEDKELLEDSNKVALQIFYSSGFRYISRIVAYLWFTGEIDEILHKFVDEEMIPFYADDMRFKYINAELRFSSFIGERAKDIENYHEKKYHSS